MFTKCVNPYHFGFKKTTQISIVFEMLKTLTKMIAILDIYECKIFIT